MYVHRTEQEESIGEVKVRSNIAVTMSNLGVLECGMHVRDDGRARPRLLSLVTGFFFKTGLACVSPLARIHMYISSSTM